jgi:putative ABC transport system permease protein
MTLLGEALVITRMSLATIPQRLGSSLVIVVGLAGVVGVLVALLAMRDGFQATLAATGRGDEAIVLRGGANSELGSRLTRDDVTLIAQGPGILRDAHGLPLVSAEVVVVANIPKKATGTDANVEIRGVGPRAFAQRGNLRIVAGREFQPGRRELIVGQGAARQFDGLELGHRITLNNEPWEIVGVFAADNAHDSELWGDAESVQATYRRDGFQAMRLTLTAPSAFATLKAALTSDPRLRVDVRTTREYYAAQSDRLRRLIDFLATAVAVIMAVGATFGALNTMYAAVAARTREIAILRALGFGAAAVILSVLCEGLALATLGGALGAAIAWAVFDRYTVSTLGANFSQVVFAFEVSLPLVLDALRWALAVGFVGALFPAVRAARQPVPEALRTR